MAGLERSRVHVRAGEKGVVRAALHVVEHALLKPVVVNTLSTVHPSMCKLGLFQVCRM